MMEKDINQDLSYSGGRLPDTLCGNAQGRNKGSEKGIEESEIKSPSNIYIYILGAIGNTARQNRDNMRVFSKKSVCPCLKSHISMESIMVVREYASRDHRQ